MFNNIVRAVALVNVSVLALSVSAFASFNPSPEGDAARSAPMRLEAPYPAALPEAVDRREGLVNPIYGNILNRNKPDNPHAVSPTPSPTRNLSPVTSPAPHDCTSAQPAKKVQETKKEQDTSTTNLSQLIALPNRSIPQIRFMLSQTELGPDNDATLDKYRRACAADYHSASLANTQKAMRQISSARAAALAEHILEKAGNDATLHDYRSAHNVHALAVRLYDTDAAQLYHCARAAALADQLLVKAGKDTTLNDYGAAYAAHNSTAHLANTEEAQQIHSARAAALADQILEKADNDATLNDYRVARDAHCSAACYTKNSKEQLNHYNRAAELDEECLKKFGE